MEKSLKFLDSHREVAFATTDGFKPKLRVFQIMARQGNDLYFATAPHKEVYTQLQSNPMVELLAAAGDISVRVSGVVKFDVKEEMARHIYDTNPVLPRLYPTFDSLVYFRLPISTLDYYNLENTPPLIEHFEL